MNTRIVPVTRSIRRYSQLVALLLAIACSDYAVALEIEFSFYDGFENRPNAVAAMHEAADIWESLLADPVTIEIDVYELSDPQLPDDVLGGSFATYDFLDYSYAEFRAALASDATSADDATAVAHLPAGPNLPLRTWDANQNGVLLDGNDWINAYVFPTRATAKALGLPHDNFGPDAEIEWNTAFLDNGFDFDRTDGIVGLDFVATAMHEIGHVLGFNSGVDFVDVVFSGEIPFISPEDLVDEPVLEPLDLFRYTAESVPHIDLSPGGSPYFSLDGGGTILVSFASGEFFGDGDQASHWRDAELLMDSRLEDHIIQNLTSLDLLALDVIGWDLARVPEPRSAALLLMGSIVFALLASPERCSPRARR